MSIVSRVDAVCWPLFLAVAAAAAGAEPPLRSPEIEKGGAVFRLKAPGAKEVALCGQWPQGQRVGMTRDDRGVWSVKVDGLPPGVWEYHFSVDGLSMIDPLNPAIKPQRSPTSSIVHIASDPAAPWDEQAVPHGVLHTHRYVSKALGPREVVVYTPPGYRSDGDPLPVLYLAHGFTDSERTWTVHGKAHWIADALLASNRAEPMLIVMPDAHALPLNTAVFDEYAKGNTEAFVRDLREDVRPLIERAYRVRTDADGRAFAGLSMGGRHAFALAVRHADEFAWIAAFSPAPLAPADMPPAGDASGAGKGKLRLFWVPIGRQDFLLPRTEPFVNQLRAAGFGPEWQMTDGDHSWPVWRRYLADLLPRLFR